MPKTNQEGIQGMRFSETSDVKEASILTSTIDRPLTSLHGGPNGGGAASAKDKHKVAYIVSRFPKLTETFILYEMVAVEQNEVQIEFYPLLRARDTQVHPEGASIWKKLIERISKPQGKLVMHPEAEDFVARAHYAPFFSWDILRAQAHFLRHRPSAYFSTLFGLIRWNWGSPNFFFGALSIFPKSVYFAHLMQAEKASHVHAHFANHPAAAAYIVHRLTDIPYSFTAHGADLQTDQHMLAQKVAEASFVVTISNYNKEFIIENCGTRFVEKVLVIHCGVDTQFYQPAPPNNLDGPPDRPFAILCIGTMYEVKGHTYLIEACRLLQERGLDFLCHLVGNGPYLESLVDQVAKAGLAERVRFHGQLPRQEIAKLFRRVHVLSVPSIPTQSGRREGIPVVLMEAMSSGVPVVASGISGIPELVEDGHSGLLVPPRDSAVIANALERLYHDVRLRKRLGQAGREKVLSEFDLNKNANTLAQQFKRGY